MFVVEALAVRISPAVEEDLRRLSHLPVAVGGGVPEGGLDLFAVERRERDDRPAADRRSIAESVEHRGQAARVADAPDRSDRSLAGPRVGVRPRRARELVDRCRRRLSKRPACGFDDQRVGVAERGDERREERPREGERRCEVARAPPDSGVGVLAQHTCDDLAVEASRSGQRAERDLADPRVGRAEGASGRRGIPAVAGDHDVDQAERAVRGRIFPHRPSMSAHDPRRTPPGNAQGSETDGPWGAPPGAGSPTDRSRAPAGRWRAPRWARITGIVVLVLIVASVVADHVDLGYYVITPGVARPVASVVHVSKRRAHRLHGSVLLTDVYLTQVTAFTYFFDSLRGNAQILPAATVLGPATPPSQLVAQGYLEMEQSQSAAKAAALTRLGYRVGVHDLGVVVFAVVPGSPAAGALSVGQVVTAVEGRRTPDACAFARSLASRRAGALVHLTVERSHVGVHADLVPGPSVHETVRLGRWPSSVPHPVQTPLCPGTGWHGQGFLGIQAETQPVFELPFPVGLRTTSIGGPSAGLAMTLGIINTLWDGNLTGGRTVAATGTLAPTGAVGEVGGVREKTIAVERAGATVFFVPAAQVRTARSKATSSLKVYGVSSLAGALADLRRLGGSVPPTPARHGS